MKFGRWPTWFDMSRDLKNGLYKLSMKDNFLADGKKQTWNAIPMAGSPTLLITSNTGTYYAPRGDVVDISIHLSGTLGGSAGNSIGFSGFPLKPASDFLSPCFALCTADAAAGVTRLGVITYSTSEPGILRLYRSDITNFPNSGDLIISVDISVTNWGYYNG